MLALRNADKVILADRDDFDGKRGLGIRLGVHFVMNQADRDIFHWNGSDWLPSWLATM